MRKAKAAELKRNNTGLLRYRADRLEPEIPGPNRRQGVRSERPPRADQGVRRAAGPRGPGGLEATCDALAIARIIRPHVSKVVIVNTRRLAARHGALASRRCRDAGEERALRHMRTAYLPPGYRQFYELRWCAGADRWQLVPRPDVQLHPGHNWFLSAAHGDREIDNALEAAGRASRQWQMKQGRAAEAQQPR